LIDNLPGLGNIVKTNTGTRATQAEVESMTGVEAEPLLTAKEVADICSVPEQALRQWAGKGYVNPTIRGRQGRAAGNSPSCHRYSIQRTLGITTAIWAYETPKGGLIPLFSEVVEQHARWPLIAVEQLLGLRDDEWSEDTLEETYRRELRMSDPSLPDESLLPGTPKWEYILLLIKRMVKLRDALLARERGRQQVPTTAASAAAGKVNR
jgi:hypothetical protein